MLAPATLKAVLELSPLKRTSVPPDNTGFAPIEASPTLVPLEMFEIPVPPEDEPESLETHTLHAVMSKFQMPDVGVVCVKTKV